MVAGGLRAVWVRGWGWEYTRGSGCPLTSAEVGVLWPARPPLRDAAAPCNWQPVLGLHPLFAQRFCCFQVAEAARPAFLAASDAQVRAVVAYFSQQAQERAAWRHAGGCWRGSARWGASLKTGSARALHNISSRPQNPQVHTRRACTGEGMSQLLHWGLTRRSTSWCWHQCLSVPFCSGAHLESRAQTCAR